MASAAIRKPVAIPPQITNITGFELTLPLLAKKTSFHLIPGYQRNDLLLK
jgi:hypothetical protein